MLLAFLFGFGVAAVMTAPYARYGEEPTKTTLASELWGTAVGRTLAAARVPHAVIQPHMTPNVIHAPVGERVSHIAHGMVRSGSHFVVRAEIEEEVKKMIA